MTDEPANQTALGHDVFVSYASQDAAVAQKACSALEAEGFRCWIAPRDVVPGTLYADGIVGAIDESRILVLILSKDAVASAHVGKELERATSKRHPIIALRLDTAPLTRAFEYFLNESQWIEGSGSDSAIAQLVGAVGQHLAPGTGATNRAVPPAAIASKPSPARRVWLLSAVVVAVALAGGYLLDKAWRSKHEPTASTAVISDKSIAVLPFTDMSEKKDQEYFADGMAEEIIDLLVKIPGLKVISRTSSFQFKGKTEDLRSIAAQLGVAYVLQGSVRKSGERLRVTAQLINALDGTHLWSQTYDRDLSDVLKMQDEIAAKVARALQIEVGADGLVPRPALRNTDAYTLYLQGRHSFDRLDRQGLEQALSDFQRAQELDPSFAAAAHMQGAAYSVLGAFGLMAPTVAFPQARQAEDRALKLDPKLAVAHVALAYLYKSDSDWPAADREYQLALALAPRDATVLFLAAGYSMSLGRWDEALQFVNSSLELDPLNASSYGVLSKLQARSGRLPEAEAAARRALAISPTFATAHVSLGSVLLARGESEAALAEMLKEGDETNRLEGCAMAYFALGRKADSDAAFSQLLKNKADQHAFGIAKVYAFRGETDEAFTWLDRAFVQKDSGLVNIKVELSFKKLEVDSRYKAFLKKMNFPE